jgi:hypothetical protein
MMRCWELENKLETVWFNFASVQLGATWSQSFTERETQREIHRTHAFLGRHQKFPSLELGFSCKDD